jgi:predicted nucleic acid-binding protein
MKPARVVSNASPLIALSKIEELSVLKQLWGTIIIPQAVYRETVIAGAGKSGCEAIAKACGEWIQVMTVNNKAEVDALRAVLDEGEAEAIALGQEIQAGYILLDNKEPRMFARNVNLTPLGTIGILSLAYRQGLLKDPVVKIYDLRAQGFWVSDLLVERFKREMKQ